MPPVSRWHHQDCQPDVRVIGGLPYCCFCSSIPNCQFRGLQLPGRPTIPSHDRLRLSWPASVIDRIQSESFGNDNSDAPVTHSMTSANTVTGVSDSKSHISTASQCPFYDYEDLVIDDQFRVLELSQGLGQDPLHGILATLHLSEFSGYEALSYTWAYYDALRPESHGDDALSELIYLGDFWDALPITRNCRNALRSLRYPDRKRYIWVDSISVNQWHAKERGHQVSLMGRIFKNALSVVAYLGTESLDSDLALQLLRDRQRLTYMTWTEQDSIHSLFKRPYFTRIWIVQEIAMAKSLHFYCGNSETFFSPFTQLPFQFSAAPPWLKYARQQALVEAKDLLSLLEDTAICQYSDPRDRIFAILGLVVADDNQGLKADYHLSVEQVYTGIAALFLQSSEAHLLRVLKLAANSPQSESYPSWVPDWGHGPIFYSRSGTINTYSSHIHNKSRKQDKSSELMQTRYRPLVQISPSGRLTVRGYLLSSRLPWHTPYTSSLGPHRPYTARQCLIRTPGDTLNLIFKFKKQYIRKVSHFALFMLQNYSTMLLLCPPSNGSDEFSFIDIVEVDEVEVLVGSSYQKSIQHFKYDFCLVPLSPHEQALVTGILSRPSQFPTLPNAWDIWKKSPADWIGNGSVRPEALAQSFYQYYTTETQLWEQWLDLESKGLAILQSRRLLDAVLDRLQLMKCPNDWQSNNREWDEFKGGDFMMRHGVDVCWIANFLSLIILDPRSPLSSLSTSKTSSNPQGYESSAGLVLESDPLDVLRDWARLSFTLMNHLKRGDSDILGNAGFPGGSLLGQAQKVWTFHMKIAKFIKKGKAGNEVWYTWFMAKKISRQRVEKKDVGLGENFRAPLDGEAYWDWNELKNIMKARAELWPEVNHIIAQLKQELADVDIKIMRAKLASRKFMEEVGLQVDNMVEEKVTIV